MIAASVLAGAGAVLADDESRKSGPIGLAVILVLCVVCYFLFKSMSKHLRKVREQFPPPDPAGPAVQRDQSPPGQLADPPAAEGDHPGGTDATQT